MKEIRRVAGKGLSRLAGENFAHDEQFLRVERDDSILELLLQNLAITAAVVAGALVLLIGPVPGLLIGICVAVLDACLLGLLIAFGWPLSVVAFLNLSMVIGMCVDYIAHAMHTMEHALNEGKDPQDALVGSLELIGRCIFEGAFSTLCGLILPALLGKSQAARMFGTTLCLAIVLGAAYGLIWVPTLYYVLLCAKQRITGKRGSITKATQVAPVHVVPVTPASESKADEEMK